jgi:hypothetical protein
MKGQLKWFQTEIVLKKQRNFYGEQPIEYTTIITLDLFNEVTRKENTEIS